MVVATARNAPAEFLVDINVFHAGIVGVVFDSECEVERGYSLSLEPRHALKSEQLIGVIAEMLGL